MQATRRKWTHAQSQTAVIAFIVLLLIIAVLFYDTNFFTLDNFSNILLKAARNGGLLALGLTFVILTGEIDLSVGSVVVVSGIVAGLVGQTNPVLGILAGLLTGVVSGALLGFMVAKMELSSWVASLAMLFGLRGVALVLTGESVSLEGPVLTFAQTQVLEGVIPGLPNGVSILVVLFLLITLACAFISRYTSFGLQLYTVGGNAGSARMMGVNVDRVKMTAFILSGFMAALSGVFMASHLGSASLSAGNTYETIAIAMCAIGGIRLSGGVGRFSGTFFGILIYFMLDTVFTYMPNVSTHWQTVIMGILVLISVTIQSETLSEFRFKKAGQEAGSKVSS